MFSGSTRASGLNFPKVGLVKKFLVFVDTSGEDLCSMKPALIVSNSNSLARIFQLLSKFRSTLPICTNVMLNRLGMGSFVLVEPKLYICENLGTTFGLNLPLVPCMGEERVTATIERDNTMAGLHRLFFCPITKVLMNFCKRLKTTRLFRN